MNKILLAPRSFSGLLVALVGVVFVFLSRRYEFGSLSQIGPGFLPTVYGIALIVLGTLSVLFDDPIRHAFSDLRILPMVSVLSALVAWALLLNPVGFVPATMALAAIGYMASTSRSLSRFIILIISLPALGYLIFIVFLKVPVSAF